MAPLLSDLVAVGDLGLRYVVEPQGPVHLTWAHGSDLDDPTPFMEAGQLLLTTGGQFDPDVAAVYSDYVARLVGVGVAALGFGTEVIRKGTPDALIAACSSIGLPLIEVPYGTPFIAISKWVADRLAAQARVRADWARETQGAISVAAIGAGGLRAAVTRAAKLLDAAVVVVDPELNPIAAYPDDEPRSRPVPGVLDDVRMLVERGRRAELRHTDGADAVLIRTLGHHGGLRGAMTVRRATPYDDADLSAITTLTALAEVSLEHGQDIRDGVRALLAELFGLLLDGRVEIVRKAISGLPAGLPDRRFVVVALHPADLPTGLAATLERHAADPDNRTLHVIRDRRILLLVDHRRWRSVGGLLRAVDARAGASEMLGWDDLAAGVTQATRSLESAPPGRILRFADLTASSLLGLLATTSAADIARARVEVLSQRADSDELLAAAATWLRHNGRWDPAARELGLHRHSLKLRVGRLGDLLSLDLEQFPARAELWALLAALDRTHAR